MNFIGADLGGTKSILRLFSASGETIREKRYDSGEHESFESVLADFLDGQPPVTAACFVVAGPVFGTTARITNLPWVLDADQIVRTQSVGQVRLVNDFHGVAASLDSLGMDDLAIAQEGKPDRSFPFAILGAGTGLGEAIVADPDGSRTILSTEGGHCDFAPATALQDELLARLRDTHGHVSWERIVSGPGIVEIYTFLAERENLPHDRLADASGIMDLADGGDETAEAAVNLFVDCYGAEAGNLALKSLPRGGLYVGGGIAAKNVQRITDGRFIRAFTAKGRFRELLETIPVFVITNPDAGLIGACALASSMA